MTEHLTIVHDDLSGDAIAALLRLHLDERTAGRRRAASTPCRLSGCARQT